MAGYPKSKEAVDAIAGELSQALNRDFRRLIELKTELDFYNDAALTGLGYTTAEVTSLRTLATSIGSLYGIYTGTGNLVVASDFRPAFRAMWGILGDH